MKELTLNQAWKLCLRQWKWIIEQIDEAIRNNNDWDVGNLKVEYLEKYYKDKPQPLHSCFFCEYTERGFEEICEDCPGRLVDNNFSCCNIAYCYYDEPHKFYAKLLELDAKRRSK